MGLFGAVLILSVLSLSGLIPISFWWWVCLYLLWVLFNFGLALLVVWIDKS